MVLICIVNYIVECVCIGVDVIIVFFVVIKGMVNYLLIDKGLVVFFVDIVVVDIKIF